MRENGFHDGPAPGGDQLAEFGFEDTGERWLEHLRAAQVQPALGRIGRYELLEEISRGGQGIVYRARDTRTHRDVAIKRLVAGALATTSMRHRFEREVEAAASLDHPNIVTVFGTEAFNGEPVLVMAWIDGVPINQWRRPDGRLPAPRDVMAMFAKVCDAVHHAHRRGVIHRDLKPSNILVTAEGTPRVLDFGTAKLDAPATGVYATVTRSGSFMGTPAYASPEHVRGTVAQVDVRSDVYALGVILYELLCGRLPYAVDGGLADVFHAVEHAEPVPPRRLRPTLDREIEAIVLKALRKDPDERYSSVEAFGEDLTHALDGTPVVARGHSVLYLARKALHRHRAGVLIGGAMLGLVLGYMLLMPVLFVRAEDEADRARQVQHFLQDTLATVSPFRPGADLEVTGLLARAVERLDSVRGMEPDVEASIRLTIAKAYASLWRWPEADRQARRAASILRTLPGGEARLAECLNEIGKGMAFHRNPGAVHVLEEALAIRQHLYGDTHPLVAETLATLGFASWNRDDWNVERAEGFYRRSLEMFSATQTLMDSRWARSLFSAAMFNLNVERYETAEPLFEQAIAALRHLDDEAFYRIETLRGQARLFQETGRSEASVAFLLEAEALYPRRFRDETLAKIHWGLRRAAVLGGNEREADARARQAMSVLAATLARLHPERADELERLAWRFGDEVEAPWIDLYGVMARLDDPMSRRWQRVLENAGLVSSPHPP